jgi:hypothetical protein
MQNVDIKLTGDKAVITIDLSKRLGDSKTGKTVLVASTGGNKDLGETGIKLGLNAFVSKAS